MKVGAGIGITLQSSVMLLWYHPVRRRIYIFFKEISNHKTICEEIEWKCVQYIRIHVHAILLKHIFFYIEYKLALLTQKRVLKFQWQYVWQVELWVWFWICPLPCASGSLQLLLLSTRCWEVSTPWPTLTLYSLFSYLSVWWVRSAFSFKCVWRQNVQRIFESRVISVIFSF